MSNEKRAEDIFGDIVSTNDTLSDVESNGVDRCSPGWHDYIMSLFTEDEIVEGMPKVAGLRRVSEMLFGPPIFSGPTKVFPADSSDHPGRATVIFTVQFKNASYSDVADSWVGNTDDAFVVYNVAMASTRAEARALRKALGLHGAAFEEITKKDTSNIVRDLTSRKDAATKTTSGETLEGLASSRQLNFITSLTERAKIDLNKMLVSMSLNPDKSMTKQNATEIIDTLNSYINGGIEIPQEIRVS